MAGEMAALSFLQAPPPSRADRQAVRGFPARRRPGRKIAGQGSLRTARITARNG